MAMHKYNTAKEVTISGNNNQIYIRQHISFGDIQLVTLWQRLWWLATGKVKILVHDEASNSKLLK